MKHTAFALVAALLFTIPAQAQEQTPHLFADLATYVALVGGAAADLGTTYVAFQHGAVEMNRLTGEAGTRNITPLVIKKSIATAALSVGMWYFAAHGHPKAAKMIGYAAGATWGTAAVLNARTIHQMDGAR